jgi:hypothetical protein
VTRSIDAALLLKLLDPAQPLAEDRFHLTFGVIGNQKVILFSGFKDHTIFIGFHNRTDWNVQVSLIRAFEMKSDTRKFELSGATAKHLFMCSLISHRMVMGSRGARWVRRRIWSFPGHDRPLRPRCNVRRVWRWL